jgi:hypothetical protein
MIMTKASEEKMLQKGFIQDNGEKTTISFVVSLDYKMAISNHTGRLHYN